MLAEIARIDPGEVDLSGPQPVYLALTPQPTPTPEATITPISTPAAIPPGTPTAGATPLSAPAAPPSTAPGGSLFYAALGLVLIVAVIGIAGSRSRSKGRKP